nr:RNA-directed DNA polymerase, eukaryota, reverse transcriptase zinc-binding domain protein [Tanacetum cinerariifolium]
MEDFNEVRSADERQGSMFYPSMARCFNNFISSSSLVDIKLEGFSFTWSHPSASKLSKLDRFLVSEDSNGMIRFKKKLHGLKIVIRNWVKAKKIHLSGVRCSIKYELSDNDKDLDRGDLSDSKLHRRMDLLHQLHDIDISDSKDFIQKSKIKWAVEEPDSFRLKFQCSFNNRLSPIQVEDLEKSVTRDEIRMAVWSCGENKSPGPDGYSFEFLRKYWNITGIDFCEAVECFFSKDYRPISLIGCIYKVVTKVLSNRLAPIISDLVSDTQSAFVANRQILDGPFILSEVMSWCKRKKKQAMFFKVDFAKAYDSVRWDFLLDVIQAFGFGPNWCKWIRGTFSNAMASILVNGSPSSEFQFHSGLKQGDPLFPYLFILIMESLHFSFSLVVNEGIFKGISLNGKSSISHLFYADDAILTLLKSVIGASPIYNMSIYKVPKGVLKTMESIRNSFFNGADPSNKKITWAAWNKVLADKKNGGLGVSSLHALNRALLLKWVSSNWCSILRELEVLKSKGFNFLSHCSKRIGDGCQTRFWQDRWLAGMVLRDSFPRISALELDKDVSKLVSMLESVSLSSAQDRWCCDLSGDDQISFNVGFLWTHFHVLFVKLLKNLFIITCFNVPWPSSCSVRFVDGGICIGKICRRFQIGLPGSQLSVSLKNLRRCWKVFSILRGGLFGCFAIVLSLMLRLQDDQLSLMILFPYPSFGVIVDVIWCSLGNFG